MRLLIVAICTAALAWAGYWWFGAQAVERETRAWLDARGQEGWVANYAEVGTAGFPNRFDTTITGLELADPETGIAWTAPVFQILRLSYRPDHLIFAFAGEQSVASPHQRIDVASGAMRASVVLDPGAGDELERLQFVADEVSLISTLGWGATLDRVLLATRPAEAREDAVDVGFEATALSLKGTLLSRLAGAGLVPGEIEALEVEATLDFDGPWNRSALEERRPDLLGIDLDVARLTWGAAEIWAAGAVTLDAAGLATGEVTVKARNWRELLKIAVAAGWLGQGLADSLEQGLSLLAGLSGSRKTLDAPLTVSRGRVSLGPIPLGTLPPLRMR